eukprot:CAMPEP_0202698190 /NCGR_PEP_ID=MMETSP1385-20130828/11456_1 /ASSEMBLY_ACC=CAM_ASM_000861 /TAXON_ID=933848 /ORGANISM="Elphidium margaritaceum" /LENGTH=696 /DNA_ID=CAMNT_0049354839 /DNA_START=20 /DNA_END=2110 /DNA_ORIENTATION=-
MDAQSLNFNPTLRSADIAPKTKLSKREKKFLKKQRKARNSGSVWGPIDRRNSITLHLVHRSTNDPLLSVPDEHHGEWVLEPEVNCRSDFERVQQFFTSHDLEDSIPHQYRSDEFIERTSAKSMPILPSRMMQSHKHTAKGMDSILEYGDDYDYEQHYRCINEGNLITPSGAGDHSNEKDKKKLRLKDGVQVLEQYLFEEEYESNGDDDDNKDEAPKMDEKHDDDDDGEDENDFDALLASDCEDVGDDLQDDFVMYAMGVDNPKDLERVTIAEEMPPGARFGQWTELDVHRDKFDRVKQELRTDSLYDQTINRLMQIQSLKNSNEHLDDIPECGGGGSMVSGQFDDASDSDDEDDDEDGDVEYNPDLPLLDGQFEIMLQNNYNDDWIGELDDDMIGHLRDEFGAEYGFGVAAQERFSAKNKSENLRYQYYVYLKKKKQKLRRMLKKANRACTLDLMQLKGIDEVGENVGDEVGDEVGVDSDDEEKINAELEQEFKKKAPPKWDVESILSTRTNHENHPTELLMTTVGKKKANIVSLDRKNFIEFDEQFGLKNIDEHRGEDEKEEEVVGGGMKDEFKFGDFGNLNGAAAVSDGKRVVIEFGDNGDNGKNGDDETGVDKDGHDDKNSADEEDAEQVTAYSKRKGETKEDKKARKRLRKELKQQRRCEKKANKTAFKETMKHNTKMTVTHTKSHGNALRI